MKKTLCLVALIIVAAGGQDWPNTWSQSYGTYDAAAAAPPGVYALGFSVNNYCLYNDRDDEDTIAFDERKFDLWARIGLLPDLEFELKYSSPTCALLGIKYQLGHGTWIPAMKFGVGYMKGTREGAITDYVYDFYPTAIVEKRFSGGVRVYLAPKAIFSIHARDRQEHTSRPHRFISQYGFTLGIALGGDFAVLPETNWLWADNEGVDYIVNQFGIGVSVRIR